MVVEQKNTAFKQTEVGEIPEDWEVRSLNELIENLEAGVSVNSIEDDSNFYDYGYHILKTSSVSRGMFYPEECKTIAPNDIKRAKLNPKAGSIIISRMNTPDLVGELGYVPKDYLNLFIPDRLWQTKFRQEKDIDSKWLTYILNIPTNRKKLKDEATGTSSSMKNISKKAFLTIRVPYPTLAEQTAIATALSDADALIGRLETLIAKKKAIKQGTMQELLRPKDGWEVKTLGEIGNCIIGLTYSPSNVRPTGKLVLRSSNIQGNKLAYEDNVFVNIEVSEKITTRKGDILICVRNGSRNLIGKCAYIDGRGVGETFGAFMSVFRSAYNDYIFHVLQSNYIQKQIEETVGATINQLTNKNLNSFEIPFPDKTEQTRIAQILSDMDAEIEKLEQRLEKQKQLKQGMMQVLLTGKIRLV